MAKTSIPREEKGGGRKRRQRGGRRASWQPEKERERERRGGEGIFMVPTQGSKIHLDLN